MPCTSTGLEEGDRSLPVQEARASNTLVTQLLCATLLEFEKLEEFDNLPADVHKWWAKHKKIDEKRRRRERAARAKATLIRQAKKKLTGAERRALKLE